MKKYLLIFLCIFCISLFIIPNVYATEVETLEDKEIVNEEIVEEDKNKEEIPKEEEEEVKCNFELSEALEDKNLTKILCFETYNEALEEMNKSDKDNLVIVEKDTIINSKYAVIDFDISYPSTHRGYINVYTSATSTTTNSQYIRSSTPDDAVVIDYNHDTKRVKIKIAGVTGWIKNNESGLKQYDIVPLIWAKTPSYYKVTDTALTHYFPGNVYGTKSTTSLTIDKKPVMLKKGTYYSYDGHYFYNSMKELIQDYKNGNYSQSVNKDEPYYNYYQYLSFRTRTMYSAENINHYISLRTSKDSKMLNTGEAFIDVQNKYGVNAALMMAIGMNESGKGTSSIAKNKNNLFGLNAVDQTPGESANYFKTVEDCINDYGYAWLSYGYLHPGDTRFKGANLGNKLQGLNYRYASDPYWSEKAAHFYYDLDSTFGFQDYNNYQIAVLKDDYSNKVYPKKTIDGLNVSTSYYQYKLKDSPVVVLGEKDGWYKIQADPTLDKDLEYYGDSKSNPRIIYDWDNNLVYVKASYFVKVNKAVNEVPNLPELPEIKPEEKPENKPIEEEKEEPKAKEISLIIEEAKYKQKDKVIFGIKPETSVKDVNKNLTNTGGIIKITDIKGNVKKDGNIGTGDKVSITSGVTEIFEIIINGDLTGDGKINSADLLRMRQHLLGTELSGVYKEAGYMGYDKINSANLLKLRQYLLGKVDIEQK